MLALQEIMTDSFGDKAATYYRGSKPIDRISISQSIIRVTNFRYLLFGYFMSDHRLLGVDILESIPLCFNLPPLLPPA